MPALVLRARQEILPGFGFILPAAKVERFAAAAPSAYMAEIDANHYTITMHGDAIAAIGALIPGAKSPRRSPQVAERSGAVAQWLARTSRLTQNWSLLGCAITVHAANVRAVKSRCGLGRRHVDDPSADR
jgi:hypothetical protein